jgi:hypothetical protein
MCCNGSTVSPNDEVYAGQIIDKRKNYTTQATCDNHNYNHLGTVEDKENTNIANYNYSHFKNTDPAMKTRVAELA